MGETRDIYKIFMEKPSGKQSLRRIKRKWGKNIKMKLNKDVD
jgi:hypothetical protein